MRLRTALVLVVVLAALPAGCDRPTPAGTSWDMQGAFAGWEGADSGRPLMRLAGPAGEGESRVHVSDSAEVIIDGRPAALTELREGMQVTLTGRDKMIVRVEARSAQPPPAG